MTKLFQLKEIKNKKTIFALTLLFSLFLGLIDYISGYEISFFIFYILPVSLVAWKCGRYYGLAMSLIAVAIWYSADIFSNHVYSASWILHWNGAMRLILFIITTFVLSSLKKRMDNEIEWARIDSLTGAINGRGFRERLDILFPLAGRTKSSFAMAFIDLDNFKKVNDTRGHATGDVILKGVVDVMTKHTRTTDIVARLGGDEFVIFLPNTKIEGAKSMMKVLREHLIAESQEQHWGIGYSIGVVTIDLDKVSLPHYQDVINAADQVMYKVKQSGKGNVEFVVFGI